MEHLRSYPAVSERLSKQSLNLHGWWFDLATISIHAYEEAQDRFVLIDEDEARRILARLDNL